MGRKIKYIRQADVIETYVSEKLFIFSIKVDNNRKIVKKINEMVQFFNLISMENDGISIKISI